MLFRSAEIAGLEWADVTDAMNGVGRVVDGDKYFEVPGAIAKKGRGRVIPMHPALVAALELLRTTMRPQFSRGREKVVRGAHARAMTSGAIQKYVGRIYTRLGLDGCSSHSGRRSFITAMTRTANNYGCSMRDAQLLAGHAHLSSTQPYVDPSHNVAAMVRGI